ncbi:MAG: DNA primase catalytic subunit PriS [Candidatus Hermodarchaeota archaeon]
MSNELSKTEKRRVLREYYKNKFELEPLLQVIGRDDFPNREFGFFTLDEKFLRNFSFKTPSNLRDFLIQRTPLSAYVGAVFDAPPTAEKRIHKLNWIRREFIVDLDLTDYDTIRPEYCGCRGANQVCSKCWAIIQDAIWFLTETLEKDFGLKKIHWFFSGRRGVHAWITDSQTSRSNTEQRASIVEYFSLVRGEEIYMEGSDVFKTRVFDYIIQSFLLKADRRDLKKMKITEPYWLRKILETQDLETIKLRRRTFREIMQKQSEETKALILKFRSPRIDRKCSIDINRLLRMPGSIHGVTGKICRKLSWEEIKTFNPLMEPSIFDV